MKNSFATPAQRAEDRLSAIALLLAPATLTLSTFYWTPGRGTGIAGSLLISVSFMLWVVALRHLFSRLRDRLPEYAAWGFLVAVFGCFAGNNFGFFGLLTEAFQITETQQTAGMSRHNGAFALTLFGPGLLFPLSVLLLGIQLIRTKNITLWIGVVLCLGAVTFPMGRIPRLEWVGHITDVLLLVSCGTMAWELLRQPGEQRVAAGLTQPAP
jgi:hypothetical protein